MKPRSYSAQERLDLMTRRLLEVYRKDKILEILADGGNPKGWWATAPTGRPHIAYFVPFIKLAEFVNAGCDVTILFCGKGLRRCPVLNLRPEAVLTCHL